MSYGFSSEAFYLGFCLSAIVLSTLIYFIIRLVNSGKDVPSSVKNTKRRRNLADRGEFYSRLQENRSTDNVDTINCENEEASDNVVKRKNKKEEKNSQIKAMKENEREAIKQQTERKEQKKQSYEEKQKEKEEARVKEAERIKLENEEKERKAYEEYLKLKETISVEEEGISFNPEEINKEAQISDFINFIKTKKIVDFDFLALEFNLKTSEAIDRVKQLLSQKELQGIIDDRGKFIYISSEDLRIMANYMNDKGRFSISDISEISGEILGL